MCHLDNFFAREASEVIIQLCFGPVDKVCVGVTVTSNLHNEHSIECSFDRDSSH